MKVTYHVPTEQYGFVEIELNGDRDSITLEDAVARYQSLKTAPGQGLDTKEFNQCLDRYVTDGTGETDAYLRMSKEQQAVIQELKKCFKRLEADDRPLRERK